MDLGIKGRRALVCASSQGLGRACAQALADEGVELVINGRQPDALHRTADDLRSHGAEVVAVQADVTTNEGRSLLLQACPDPDILVTNGPGPRRDDFTDLSEEDWMTAIGAQMVAPILLVKAVIGPMRARRWGRIVNITSAMVTSPAPTMGLSSGARAGLTAAMKGLSRAVASDNVTINNLLPERFDTERQRFMAHREMELYSISYDEARARQAASIAAKRLGTPSEFGAACAFLCADQSGFLSGQNLHLDGGSYPALI